MKAFQARRSGAEPETTKGNLMSEKSCNQDRMNLERLAARGFVIAGGIFWIIAAFAGPYFYDRSGMGAAVTTAIYPFAATVATLVIGRTYERLAAVLLFAGAAGVVVWGVLYGWELGVWMLMSFVLIAPITIAGVLFMLAGRLQDVCELEERTSEQTSDERPERTVPAPSRTGA